MCGCPTTQEVPGEETAAVGLADVDPDLFPAGDRPCRQPLLVTVTWIWDGDTVEVLTPEQMREDVRFIGVDTPEIDHGKGADCYGDEAATYTRDLLTDREIWLTFDADCVDPYERTLAYVHLGLDEQDFLERDLLRRGLARVMTISPNDSLASTFRDDEQSAEDGSVGGWSACGW